MSTVYKFDFGEVKYRVAIALINSHNFKVTLTVEVEGGMHIDRIDLYSSPSRKEFSRCCAQKIGDHEEDVENDLFYIVRYLESEIGKNKCDSHPTVTRESEFEISEVFSRVNLLVKKIIVVKGGENRE